MAIWLKSASEGFAVTDQLLITCAGCLPINENVVFITGLIMAALRFQGAECVGAGVHITVIVKTLLQNKGLFIHAC